jgi:MinD superfamily P-loop ATPase
LKEIVVVSGKGGAGKSSTTASLSVLLNRSGTKITAVDSDVDAPNLSIVIGTDIADYIEIKTSDKASIDFSKCTNCAKCIPACEAEAIFGSKGEAPTIIPFLCEGCGACAIVCPTDAISINKVVNGRIGVAKTPYGFPIVSGQLNMGESNSGHIVTAVKSKGRKIAEESDSDLILVDGPPGIGCPVIASMTGADSALVVTEPTQAATMSLHRILSVLEHFRIPADVVINRYDLNPEYTRHMEHLITTKWKKTVLEKIPFDENMLLSLSKRVPITEYAPDCIASQALKSLSDKILKVVL